MTISGAEDQESMALALLSLKGKTISLDDHLDIWRCFTGFGMATRDITRP